MLLSPFVSRKKPVSFLLLIFVSWASPTWSEEVREYSWLTVGVQSGQQIVTHQDDGTTNITFEFNDRGRGPNTSTDLSLDDRGYPRFLHITGNNYSGGSVDERFEILDRSAEWRSNIESGSVSAADAGFYSAFNGNPEMLAILARALLASDSGSIEMLPSGTATISEITTRTLEQDGDSLDITLYGISGLDSSPTHVWLDQDGQLFGVDFAWFAITLKGWESHFEILKEEQDKATTAFFESLAQELVTDTGDLLVVKGARIFDSIKGSLTEPATVFSWKGRISAVYFDEVIFPRKPG